MRRAVLVVALGASGCTGFCGRDKSAPDAAAGAKPSVELLAPGKEPRVELEVGRWTGMRYWQVVENDASFGLEGQPPVKAPTSTLTAAYEVVRGAADPIVRETDAGTRRLIEEKSVIEAVDVASPELAPEALAQLRTMFGMLVGVTTRQLIADDGELAEVSTELVGGQKPTPEVQRFLDDAFDVQRRFPFRLPPAAVGAGARWRFTDPLDVRGVRATQVAEMTLLTLAGNSARISIRVRLEARTQMIPHPLDPTRQATLEGFRGDGDGELVIDRMTALVLSGRLATTAKLTLSTQEANQARSSVTFMSASVIRLRGGTGEPPAPEPSPEAGPPDAP